MTEGGPGAEDLDGLAQAYVEQARRGESPSIEAAARAHPELAEDIRELFPVLALVEGLKVGEAATERSPPRLPEQVGGYVRGRELGRGGMGTVYEGCRVAPGDGPERVAIKVVHAHLLERPEYVARFLHEAAAGRRIVHENVVRTLATGVVDFEDQEVPYILLEHVEGQNLRALLREVEVVPERLCRHVGVRLADALAAVHAAGLVHRDVKPENVVITQDETVKLMDLGVAVVQDRLQRLSQTGEFVGSLLYAAPGQVAGEDPDPSWDLHALGILLFELATGRHPARSAGLRWLRANETVRSALTRHDAMTGLSPFFAALIESLLSAETDPSLDSAEAVRDVLQQGEAASWWRARRLSTVTPTARLQQLVRPTAFYGRREEWQVLDRALAAATEGRGGVVLLEGEAGIGKSRLLYEWAASHRGTQTAPRVVLLGHAPGGAGGDESQLAAALLPILGDENLEQRLADLLASRARLAAGLAKRLRGEEKAPKQAGYDAAWLALLQALGREHATVLVSEDLHFAAREDLDRFLYFARGASAPGLLLIGTLRPEPKPPGLLELALLRHVEHVTLAGLDTEACHQLLHEASADTPHLGMSVQRIAERSDRNPMLLLELVRRVQEGTRGDTSEQTTIPDSTRGLLAARIAVLDPADRELLETAACQGYEFDPVVVAEASGTGRVHALKRFARMQHGHHLLRAAGRLYQFQHHLVQEVLYADLHPALREAYHASIGHALESAYEAPTDSAAVALCMHFLKGGMPSSARPHLRRAMEHLEWGVNTYATAEELAERALGVEGLLEGSDRAFALFVRGRTCLSTSRLDEAADALEESLALARSTGDGHLEVDLLKLLAWLARRRGDYDEDCVCLEHAAARARELGDRGLEATSISRLSVLHMDQGRLEKADELSQRAFAVLGDEDDDPARSRLKSDLAVVRIYQGRLDEAQALLEEVGRLAHELGNSPTEFLNAQEQGRLAYRRGRFEDAVHHARRALDLGRHLGMPHRDAFLLQNISRCQEKAGRYDEALANAMDAREIAERDGDDVMLTGTLCALSAVHTALGNLDAALDAAVSARTLAAGLRRHDLPLDAALAAAEVWRWLGRFEDVERVLGAGEEACRRHGPPARRAGFTVSRARLKEAQGRLAEAHALFVRAAAEAKEAALLEPPHRFWCARALVLAGRPEEALEALRDTIEWGRASGVASCVVLPTIYLAGRRDGDLLTARVVLEQHAHRLAAVDRIEAHHALWQADGDDASLAAAHRELEHLVRRAPAGDREAMRRRVDHFRRVSQAWAGASRKGA